MLTQEIHIFTDGALKFEADIISQANSELFISEVRLYDTQSAIPLHHVITDQTTSIEAFRAIMCFCKKHSVNNGVSISYINNPCNDYFIDVVSQRKELSSLGLKAALMVNNAKA